MIHLQQDKANQIWVQTLACRFHKNICKPKQVKTSARSNLRSTTHDLSLLHLRAHSKLPPPSVLLLNDLFVKPSHRHSTTHPSWSNFVNSYMHQSYDYRHCWNKNDKRMNSTLQNYRIPLCSSSCAANSKAYLLTTSNLDLPMTKVLICKRRTKSAKQLIVIKIRDCVARL